MDRIPALHRRTTKQAESPLLHGTIVSFTVVRHPPEGFGTDPYTVALIERNDGTRVMAQLTADSVPTIGARVAPCMRRLRTMDNGLRVNGLKYRVLAAESSPLFSVTAYVLAVSGPSGVGKTTIARSLLSLFSSYAEQVPMITTRAVRKDDSEPYIHVNKKSFDALLASGEIISHTRIESSRKVAWYGYRKKDIEAIWQRGKLPIVVTEIQLLTGLVRTLGRRSILSCGLLPPGKSKRTMLSALLHRLRSRGNHTEEQIQERLKIAEADLLAYRKHSHLFDHLMVNDRLELCVEQISKIAVRG